MNDETVKYVNVDEGSKKSPSPRPKDKEIPNTYADNITAFQIQIDMLGVNMETNRW